MPNRRPAPWCNCRSGRDFSARLSWLVATFSLLLAARARAGNDDELFVGNRASLSAGAVSATVSDASAAWYNPAGLGGATRDQIDVSATAYTLRLYSVPKLISTPAGDARDGHVNEFVVAACSVGILRRLAPGIAIAAGYFAPRASNLVMREELDAPTPQQQRSHWQIALSSAGIQHTGALALGFAVSERLRAGVSLIGGYSTQTESTALFGSVRDDERTLAATNTTLIGTTSTLTLEAGLGVQLVLSPAWTLGVTHRTPRLQLTASADASLSTSTALRPDAASGQQGLLVAEASKPLVSSGVELITPGRTGMSLAFHYGTGHITAEADIQPALNRPSVQVDLKTRVNARVGVYQPLSQAWAIGFGVFTDRTAERKNHDFVSGQGDFYGVSLGAEFSNRHLLAATEPVDSLVFSSFFALRYAFSSAHFGRTVADPNRIDQGPFQVADGQIQVQELGLYVGTGLGF